MYSIVHNDDMYINDLCPELSEEYKLSRTGNLSVYVRIIVDENNGSKN